ncbi:hypothetical protein DFO66_10476 [Brevibacterium sanguinis]|uniref:N-acetyltransferase domain-containing protein n=2 Tax=Brevibacterium TaxID=1696 RepID=A0A366IL21_9MICO|nr:MULTISPECIES: GNAT family N-acetyltransferase [Brevibacterium]RBP65493.1 hypothetical protein DFO66_10476 [Brevibacterium sanguinis]RBP72127.1 hypothetical protein DFO65_10482 [Brevibacterium celere]
MDLEIADESFTFAEDADRSRFTVSHEGKVIGMADYVDQSTGIDDADSSAAAGSVRVFTHTEVSPAFGGRGIAAHLVRFALETTAEEGMKFRTTCSYVMSFLERHPEFEGSRA